MLAQADVGEDFDNLCFGVQNVDLQRPVAAARAGIVRVSLWGVEAVLFDPTMAHGTNRHSAAKIPHGHTMAYYLSILRIL